MNTPQVPSILTHFSPDDGVFRIWGIVDRERYEFIENVLQMYHERLAQGMCTPQLPSDLMPGRLVLVHQNNQFFRGSIIRVESAQAKTLRVRLLDVGSVVSVPPCELRTMNGIHHFRTIDEAPCAEDYILCDVLMKPAPWTIEDMVWANRILRMHSDVKVAAVVAGKNLITCPIADNYNNLTSFGTCLVNRGLAEFAHIEQVKAVVMSKHGARTSPNQFLVPPPGISNMANVMRHPFPFSPRPEPMALLTTPSPPHGPPGFLSSHPRPGVPKAPAQLQVFPQQFRLDTIPVGSQHEIYVSHIVDGMQQFCIQLKKLVAEKLTKLMAQINDIKPEPIEQLCPGIPCLGRFSEDNTLCRAVLSMVMPDGVNLWFVDFGNTEIVPFGEIYKIPPQFMEEPLMALPFTLANLSAHNSLTTQEAQKIFSDLVMNTDQLIMKVTSPEIQLKQYCELFIREKGNLVNVKNKILDKVKLMKPVEYQKILSKPNTTVGVIVSFVESPNRFFVQLEVNQPYLNMLTASVEEYCRTAEMKELLYVEDVNENMAVCCQYSLDSNWYRGIITEEPDAHGNVSVFYVDYGNQDMAHYSKLRIMNNEMISKFPMQAIECQLVIDPDFALRDDVIAEFVEMVDANAYTMKVLSVLDSGVLVVELFDEQEQNIKDLLLKKFGQGEVVSPLNDRSSKSSTSPSAGNNWRDRNNSSYDGDFSAFRREENQQRSRSKISDSDDHIKRNPDFKSQGIDETDKRVESSDRWSQDNTNSFDRSNKRPSRDDWSSNREDDRSAKLRDDNRRFDRDGGDRKPFRRQDDGDSRNSRVEDRGFKKPFYRDDRRGAGGNSYRKNEDDWNYNRDDSRDERKPYRKRDDDGGKSDWNDGEKTNNEWNGRKNDYSRGSKNNDSDCSGKKNDSDRSNKKSDSDWSNKKSDSDWGGKKTDFDHGGKPKFDRDDRRPRRDGDYKPRVGGFNSRDGFKQRSGGFGVQNDGFGSTPPLSDGYAAGSQIAESNFQTGQQMEVAISWFLNPVLFFLIPANNADFRQLMENVQHDYPQRKNVELDSLSSGNYVVARDKESVIYRAKVIQTRPGGATVTFVDYGNSESVSRNQIWAISSEHCSLPTQAVCCGLYNISSTREDGLWSLPADLDKYFGKEKYTVTFVECREEGSSKTWFVNMVDENNVDIADILVEDGFAVKNTVLKSEELYDIELFRDQILTVFPGHIESSKKFYVHIEPQKAEEIREKIASLVARSDLLISLPADKLKEGEFCLATADDDVYYRAQILKVNEAQKLAHIVYIDYGDKNDVEFETIKGLPEYLMVYNPQIIECYLHDSESFIDDESFIEAIADKDFMIKVMDVIENKLSVLVYDISGSRLPYPVEVEETMNSLCSLPILKSREKVFITHITSDKVYLSRVLDIDYIANLCEQLKQTYDSEELVKVPLETGVYYAAKSKLFESWYRCILPFAESQEVYYIDYGNTEPVDDLLAVKPLNNDFFASPAYCVAAYTSIKFTTTELAPLIELVSEVIFEAVFKKHPKGWFVDLKCEKTGKTFTDFASECSCTLELIPLETEENQKSYVAFDNWKRDEEINVAVAHVISPNSFYLHRASDVSKILTMQRNLQLILKKLLPVVGSHEGPRAMQKSDGEWCRAVILNKQNAFAIDFGETLTLSVIKKLPLSFALDQSNYIIECSLNIKPIDAKWSEEAITRFSEVVNSGKEIVAKLEFSKNPRLIDLIVDGISVSSVLVNENLADWQCHEVIICHANSLSEFYVQEPDQENELLELSVKLREADSWEGVDPAVDDFVVAQFVDDLQWYRALLIRIEDNVKYVRFIDYGNESACEQFRALPDSLKSIPNFAIKCCLHSIPENAEELNEKFVNLVKSADGSFTAYFLSRVEPLFVLLSYNNTVIEEMLAEKPTEITAETSALTDAVIEPIIYDNVAVCHINSPSSFYVQSETAPLDCIETSLADIESAEVATHAAVGDLVVALFLDDGVWYRAKIIDFVDGSVKVLFIDNGNSCVVEQLRHLPDNIRNIPPLSKHCAFFMPSGLDQWPDIAKQRFAELTCEGMTIFKLNLLEDGDPAFVDLQDAGVNVADELATLCKADLTTTPLLSKVTEPTVLLSHVESLTEIWIQFQTPQLDEMTDEMANAETFEASDAAEEGSLVAALFEDDGVWYRAKLMKVKDDEYSVLFIDYGNGSNTKSIKSLPADLVNLPALAKCCRLKGLVEISEKHLNAVLAKLKETVDLGQTFALCELFEDGDVNYVSLVDPNGKDLATELTSFYNALVNSTEERLVTYVDSLQFEDADEEKKVANTTDDADEENKISNTTEEEKPLNEISENDRLKRDVDYGKKTDDTVLNTDKQPADSVPSADINMVDEKTDETKRVIEKIDSQVGETISSEIAKTEVLKLIEAVEVNHITIADQNDCIAANGSDLTNLEIQQTIVETSQCVESKKTEESVIVEQSPDNVPQESVKEKVVTSHHVEIDEETFENETKFDDISSFIHDETTSPIVSKYVTEEYKEASSLPNKETSVTEYSFTELLSVEEDTENGQFESAIETVTVSAKEGNVNESEIIVSCTELCEIEVSNVAVIEKGTEFELADTETKSRSLDLPSSTEVVKVEDSEPSTSETKHLADENICHVEVDKARATELVDCLTNSPSNDSLQYRDAEELNDSELVDSVSESVSDEAARFADANEMTESKSESSTEDLPVSTTMDKTEEPKFLELNADKCFSSEFKKSTVSEQTIDSTSPPYDDVNVETEVSLSNCLAESARFLNVDTDFFELLDSAVPSECTNIKINPTSVGRVDEKFTQKSTVQSSGDTSHDVEKYEPSDANPEAATNEAHQLQEESARMSREFVSGKAFDESNNAVVRFIDDGDTFEFQNTPTETVASDNTSLSAIEANIANQWFDTIVASVNSEFKLASKPFLEDPDLNESILMTSSESDTDSEEIFADQPLVRGSDAGRYDDDTTSPEDDALPSQPPVVKKDRSLDDDLLLAVEPAVISGKTEAPSVEVENIQEGDSTAPSDPYAKLQDEDGESLSSSGGAEVARALAHADAFEDDDSIASPPMMWDRLEHPRTLLNGQSTQTDSPERPTLPLRPSSVEEQDDNISVYFDSCVEQRSALFSDDEVPPKSSTSSSSDDAEAADVASVADLFVVSFVNTPGNFFVQRVTDAKALRVMEEHLGEYKDAVLPPEQEVLLDVVGEETTLYGTEIDSRMYRVRVLSKDDGGADTGDCYKVCCVDYGRVCKTSRLFVLPESLQRTAALAMACSISLPYYLHTWPVSVCHEFDRLVLANQPKFTLRVRDAGDGVAVVDLTKGSRSIAQRMKTLCEEFNPRDEPVDNRDK